MMVGPGLEKCPRCQRILPRTDEFFFFAKSGPKKGRITGYCKQGCQTAWWHEYQRSPAGGQQRVKHRLIAREWSRRQHGVTPDRYRPARYAENQDRGT